MDDVEKDILRDAMKSHVDLCYDMGDYHKLARTERLYKKLTGEKLY